MEQAIKNKPKFKVGDIVYANNYYPNEKLVITTVHDLVAEGYKHLDEGEKYEYDIKRPKGKEDTFFEKWLSYRSDAKVGKIEEFKYKFIGDIQGLVNLGFQHPETDNGVDDTCMILDIMKRSSQHGPECLGNIIIQVKDKGVFKKGTVYLSKGNFVTWSSIIEEWELLINEVITEMQENKLITKEN